LVRVRRTGTRKRTALQSFDLKNLLEVQAEDEKKSSEIFKRFF